VLMLRELTEREREREECRTPRRRRGMGTEIVEARRLRIMCEIKMFIKLCI
jgi:hypothetical protein